jgi:hypothetical protein
MERFESFDREYNCCCSMSDDEDQTRPSIFHVLYLDVWTDERWSE